jgi:hypothetical protein
MAANVSVVGIYGSGIGTVTELTEQRYSTTDQQDPKLAYPNNIPVAPNTNYSYWLHTGLIIKKSTGSGDKYSKLTNFRWKPGPFKNDWGLNSGRVVVAVKNSTGIDPGCPYANYDQAKGSEGNTGSSIMDSTNGHDYYRKSGECKDADNYINSPLVFDTTEYVDPNSEHLTKFLVTQLEIKPDTSFGEKSALTSDIIWSEI